MPVTKDAVEQKVHRVHFDIEGKWYTWFLRHLWVEGNELKAVRNWQAAFPNLCSVEHMKKFFLPIVTGKKKFVGWGSTGFDVQNDNRKFWDPDQSGEDNKSFPLLDSWEDVILLKKVKLYIAELELRTFKMNRMSPTTYEACHFNSLEWVKATEENKTENIMRRLVNQYWTEIRNITLQFADDVQLQLLPEDETPLQTGPTFRNRKDRTTLNQAKTAYEKIMSYLIPIRDYFEKKYGDNLAHFNEGFIKDLCGLSEHFRTDDVWEMAQKSESRELLAESAIARASSALYKTACGGVASQAMLKSAGIDIDVNSYVERLVEDSHRDRVVPDDPGTTKWSSGYIDRDGTLYTCADLDHINFAQELCEHFKIKTEIKIAGITITDHQQILDSLGWVKVTMNRFAWDYGRTRPTDAQKSTIFSFMQGKNMDKALFNTITPSAAKTMAEAFKEYDEYTDDLQDDGKREAPQE